jgi:hypothetical protein
MAVNKATGLDEISPKLLRLAEPAITPALTELFSFSTALGESLQPVEESKIVPGL